MDLHSFLKALFQTNLNGGGRTSLALFMHTSERPTYVFRETKYLDALVLRISLPFLDQNRAGGGGGRGSSAPLLPTSPSPRSATPLSMCRDLLTVFQVFLVVIVRRSHLILADHLLYSHDLHVGLSNDIVRRN